MDVASEPEASTSPTLHTAGPTASTVQDDARTCSVNLSVPRLLDEYYRIMSSNHGSDGSSSSFMNGLTVGALSDLAPARNQPLTM